MAIMLKAIADLIAQPTFLEVPCTQQEHSAYFAEFPQPLAASAIGRLEAQGCRAEDWGRVLIAAFCPLDRIRNVHFAGDCWIGNLSGDAHCLEYGVPVERCLEDAHLRDVVIGDGCFVRGLAQGYRLRLMKTAGIFQCGIVAGGPGMQRVLTDIESDVHYFGVERAIAFAPGGGNRRFAPFPTMESRMVAWLAENIGDSSVREEYAAFHDGLLRRIARGETVLGHGAIVQNTPRFLRSGLGPYGRVNGAKLVEECCLFSYPLHNTEVSEGATLRFVQTGGGVRIEGAFCENVAFGESSWARHGALVTSSLIGPNSGVSGGECRSTYLGPFTAFHHQSLLIATYWPGGKGNVSAGALVGANHSGKAPDLEHWAGEGCFYGLGTRIKFPANFVEAPYTLVAAGVTTLPQKVAFPFSLINTPAVTMPDLSPALNEITPGWMLRGNVYGLLRSGGKYRSRNHAKREVLETRVLRPQFLQPLLDAERRLEETGTHNPAGYTPEGDPYYLEIQAPGIGKNFLTEKSRVLALQDYAFGRSLILALTIVEAWEGLGSKEPGLVAEIAELDALPDEPRTAAGWDRLARQPWGQAIRAVLPALEEALRRALHNRQGDAQRGERLIPDHRAIHGRPRDEEFLKTFEQKIESLRLAADGRG
ncbi:MAG: DUF4954 family protein [Sumerlaeia bacterium]